jgi:hypothetical protein
MPRQRSAAAADEPPNETPVSSEPVPSTEPARMPGPVSVDDVLKLKQDYESQREAAIQELLAQRNRIERQLRELGHDPEPAFLKPATVPKAPRKASAAKRTPKMPTTPGEKFCPVCNSNGSHDGRAHRYQKKKKAFTAEELKAYEGR